MMQKTIRINDDVLAEYFEENIILSDVATTVAKQASRTMQSLIAGIDCYINFGGGGSESQNLTITLAFHPGDTFITFPLKQVLLEGNDDPDMEKYLIRILESCLRLWKSPPRVE